ncbi:MAG TPA: GFA family protein [Planctomycetota bacterium]
MSADSDPKVRQGGCACGVVRFEVALPTKWVANCHCQNCRRAHGAAFVTYAGYPKSAFRWTAGADDLAAWATPTGATRRFCRRCGTTLSYEGPRWADEIHLARATIEGELDKPPGGHAYVDHKAAWFEITDSLPQFGGPEGNRKKETRA